MAGTFEPGQIVRSRAGRDKGKHFIVLKTGPHPFVYVADGMNRRVERPKKKNEKHLCPRDTLVDEIRRKIRARMRVTNQDVALALRTVLEEENDNKEVQ